MKIVSEYRYNITTLSVNGVRKSYTLTLDTDSLYEATQRARDVFEGHYTTDIVIDVYCKNAEVVGGDKKFQH